VGSLPEQRDGVRPRAAGGLRLVVAPVLRALVGAPRRQIDLPRWTRGREFGALHPAIVAWLDSHFEVIERGAPWLQRAGSDVWDFCKGGVSNPFLRLTPGHGATARCVREVAVVYGFDGPLTPRLRSLDQAIPLAGWERPGADGRMAEQRVNLRWRPAPALGYPPDGEGTPPWGRPPLTPGMRVSWHSRGQELGVRRDPNRSRETTRNYLPLEVSETAVPELVADALGHHDHALVVTIHLAYYSNPNARARPHRLPRYLVPTRPGH